MLMRPAKCEPKARYHKEEVEAKAKKVSEAEARDAVLTINY